MLSQPRSLVESFVFPTLGTQSALSLVRRVRNIGRKQSIVTCPSPFFQYHLKPSTRLTSEDIRYFVLGQGYILYGRTAGSLFRIDHNFLRFGFSDYFGIAISTLTSYRRLIRATFSDCGSFLSSLILLKEPATLACSLPLPDETSTPAELLVSWS